MPALRQAQGPLLLQRLKVPEPVEGPFQNNLYEHRSQNLGQNP